MLAALGYRMLARNQQALNLGFGLCLLITPLSHSCLLSPRAAQASWLPAAKGAELSGRAGNAPARTLDFTGGGLTGRHSQAASAARFFPLGPLGIVSSLTQLSDTEKIGVGHG